MQEIATIPKAGDHQKLGGGVVQGWDPELKVPFASCRSLRSLEEGLRGWFSDTKERVLLGWCRQLWQGAKKLVLGLLEELETANHQWCWSKLNDNSTFSEQQGEREQARPLFLPVCCLPFFLTTRYRQILTWIPLAKEKGIDSLQSSNLSNLEQHIQGWV